MVGLLLPKQITWVRFPSPAPKYQFIKYQKALKPVDLQGSTGFLLPHINSASNMEYQHLVGTCIGT